MILAFASDLWPRNRWQDNLQVFGRSALYSRQQQPTHFKTGLRGRQAARMVLLAYLLLTLGYPGVKFITDVVLS